MPGNQIMIEIVSENSCFI